MTSQVADRQQKGSIKEKRRKPRRQSGAAVQFENKESVAQKSRLQRTDSDKVIRRNSMERKMSVRNSIKLPQDFLDGLKGLDNSLTRLSLTGSVRGSVRGSFRDSNHDQKLSDSITGLSAHTTDTPNSQHGRVFSQEELDQMSKQALEFSDSDSEASVALALDDPLTMETV